MSKKKSKVLSKNSKSTDKLLTEVELELMGILWRLGEGSVADVIGNLPAGRELAYTSVSTILRILEQKNIVNTRKEGRGFVYIPLIDQVAYGEKSIHHLVDKVYAGAPLALVKQLIDSADLKADDLAEIKKWIEEAGAKK